MTTTNMLGRTVRLGPRIYHNTSWTREDSVFLGDRKIGMIKLNSNDRAGRTFSLVSKKSIPGRQLDWCVAQASQQPTQAIPVARIAQAPAYPKTPEHHSRL